MINTIIFDVDGTLYDETHAKIKAELITAIYISNNSSYSLETVYASYKNAKAKVIKELSGLVKRNNRINWYKETLTILGIINIDPVFLADYYWNVVIENMEIYFDLNLIIGKLYNEYKLYILTDEYFNIQIRKLQKLGIKKYFKAVVSSEITGKTKPNTKIFDHIIDLIGEKRNNIAMIGDNPNADIKGANLSSIYSIWLKRGKYSYYSYDDSNKPDIMINNYFELNDKLNILNNKI